MGRVELSILLCSQVHIHFFFFRVQAGVWLTIKQMQVRESPGPSVVLVSAGKFVVLNLGR
jgi:hypothetical protein